MTNKHMSWVWVIFSLNGGGRDYQLSTKGCHHIKSSYILQGTARKMSIFRSLDRYARSKIGVPPLDVAGFLCFHNLVAVV
ncbi:hypothetical protein P8452_73108 [Trifolium repens]|nr:hypothetical protein P8452_73108 [Trifolium repens]